jgi:hypothetical protein
MVETGPAYFTSTVGVDAGLNVAQGEVIAAGGLTITAGGLADTGTTTVVGSFTQSVGNATHSQNLGVDGGLFAQNSATIQGGVSAPILVDPGSSFPIAATPQTNSTAATITTPGVTTSYPNDLIVVALSALSNSDVLYPATISGCGLTFKSVALESTGINDGQNVWFAPAATTLSACTITITFNSSATAHAASMATFAFYGASDQPGALALNAASAATTMAGTFPNLAAGSWVIGALSNGNTASSPTAVSGTTLTGTALDSANAMQATIASYGPVGAGGGYGVTVGTTLSNNFTSDALVEVRSTIAGQYQMPTAVYGQFQVDGGVSADTVTLDGTSPQLSITGSAGGISFTGVNVANTITAAANTDGGIIIQGDLAPASTGTDITLNSTKTRTAGNLLTVANNGAAWLTVGYGGLLTLSSGITMGVSQITHMANATTAAGAAAYGQIPYAAPTLVLPTEGLESATTSFTMGAAPNTVVSAKQSVNILPTVVGVGSGSYTMTLYDSTQSTTICASASINCTATALTGVTTNCTNTPTITAADVLQWKFTVTGTCASPGMVVNGWYQ